MHSDIMLSTIAFLGTVKDRSRRLNLVTRSSRRLDRPSLIVCKKNLSFGQPFRDDLLGTPLLDRLIDEPMYAL